MSDDRDLFKRYYREMHPDPDGFTHDELMLIKQVNEPDIDSICCSDDREDLRIKTEVFYKAIANARDNMKQRVKQYREPTDEPAPDRKRFRPRTTYEYIMHSYYSRVCK